MDPHRPARRTVIRASAWSVPVVAASVSAPAFAASPVGAVLKFDTANVYGGVWNGARPTRLESNVQVQNSYHAGAPTLSSLVLTVSYPRGAASGAAATKVSGGGWSVGNVVAAGSGPTARWVYRFDWVGSVAPGSSTSAFTYRVPIVTPYPAGATFSASFTVSGGGGTAVASAPFTLPS